MRRPCSCVVLVTLTACNALWDIDGLGGPVVDPVASSSVTGAGGTPVGAGGRDHGGAGGIVGSNPCAAEELHDPMGGRCYYFYASPASWLVAGTTCQARGTGWHLVAINSLAEHDFLRFSIAPLVVDEYPWIGASDRTVEGTFEWTTGEPWTFELWETGEPDNLACMGGGAVDEDCVEMEVYPGETDGEFSDECCNEARAFVCEGPPPDDAMQP